MESGSVLSNNAAGIGLDFNTELVQHITTSIKGASYDAVMSAKSFQKKMNEDFDYYLSPLVFDVGFKIHTEGFIIDEASI